MPYYDHFIRRLLETDKFEFKVHDQQTPASTWAITHNFGRRPHVTVVDSAGNEVVGDIQYTNDNQLSITFASSFAGTAYVS